MILLRELISLFLVLALTLGASAQDQWELKKEKEGIRVYIRDIKNSDFKAFRGETDVQANLREIVALLLDVENYKEWMPDTETVEVLEEPSETEVIYYVATEVPWPASDRDGIYKMKAFYDEAIPEVSISVKALPEYMEEKKGYVRVRKSDTIYKLTETSAGSVHVDYEVAAEPGGSVPAWLVKMKVVSIPFESLEALKARAAKNLYSGRKFKFMEGQ